MAHLNRQDALLASIQAVSNEHSKSLEREDGKMDAISEKASASAESLARIEGLLKGREQVK